jgi:anti-sigma factor RsiW
MTCREADALIEDIAAGDDLPAVTAHIASCRRCSTALANARAIDGHLTALTGVPAPADFGRSVMTRIRRERWHSEQLFDWSFNVAVVFGVLVIVAGLGGIAWTMGLVSIGGDLMTVLSQDSPRLLQRLTAQSQTIALAGLLFLAAVGLWWWSENESLI